MLEYIGRWDTLPGSGKILGLSKTWNGHRRLQTKWGRARAGEVLRPMGRPFSLAWNEHLSSNGAKNTFEPMRQKYSSLIILNHLASPSRSLSSCAPSNRPLSLAGLLHKCLVYKKTWEHTLPAWWLVPPTGRDWLWRWKICPLHPVTPFEISNDALFLNTLKRQNYWGNHTDRHSQGLCESQPLLQTSAKAKGLARSLGRQHNKSSANPSNHLRTSQSEHPQRPPRSSAHDNPHTCTYCIPCSFCPFKHLLLNQAK